MNIPLMKQLSCSAFLRKLLGYTASWLIEQLKIEVSKAFSRTLIEIPWETKKRKKSVPWTRTDFQHL